MGLDAEPFIFETAVRALAEGNSLRATARIVQIDKDTACDWLDRAAQHCRTVMLDLWCNLHVTECQMDELWSFVHTKERNLPFAKVYSETYGDMWGLETHSHRFGALCSPLLSANGPRRVRIFCLTEWPM